MQPHIVEIHIFQFRHKKRNYYIVIATTITVDGLQTAFSKKNGPTTASAHFVDQSVPKLNHSWILQTLNLSFLTIYKAIKVRLITENDFVLFLFAVCDQYASILESIELCLVRTRRRKLLEMSNFKPRYLNDFPWLSAILARIALMFFVERLLEGWLEWLRLPIDLVPLKFLNNFFSFDEVKITITAICWKKIANIAAKPSLFEEIFSTMKMLWFFLNIYYSRTVDFQDIFFIDNTIPENGVEFKSFVNFGTPDIFVQYMKKFTVNGKCVSLMSRK